MTARRFTDKQEQEICRRYQAGESSLQLASAFGADRTLIPRVLRRNGLTARSLKEAHGGLTPEQEREICSRYLAGESSSWLANAFGASQSAILRSLKRHGFQSKTVREVKGGLSDALEAKACERYQAGESTLQIGKALGVTHSTVSNLLKRHGVRLRDPKDAHWRALGAEGSEICRQYLAGKNCYQLASDFGVSHSTVRKVLVDNGVERRQPCGMGDSIQDVLDATGHHAHARECSFYLYELARYSATHCKPGIAFNATNRARQSKGEYGAEALRLVFATRAEAFFLEQAVLDATRGCRDCPADLADWVGASEVRAMPAEDTVPTVLRLAEELEAMGVWAFAAAYVPMTAAQRLTCQQRAMELAHAESL